MHTHHLKLPTHEAFLCEERHDPVTGDAFREGDEVVFCASCRSAFLKSSWEYMGEEHCGQENTLAKIPYAQAIDVKKGVPFKDDLIVFSNIDDYQGRIIKSIRKKITLHHKILYSTIRVLLISFCVILQFLITFPGGIPVIAFTIAFYTFFSQRLKKYTKDFFAFGENYIYTQEEKISYHKVDSITVLIENIKARVKNSAYTQRNFHVIVRCGESIYEVRANEVNYEISRVNLIYTLLDVAQHTTIYFKSSYEEDMQLVEKLQREYEGDLRFFEEE